MRVIRLLPRLQAGLIPVGKISQRCAVGLIIALLLTVQPGLPSGGQSGDISTSNTGKQTATPQAKNNIFRDAMHFEDGWFDGADLYILPDRYDGSDLDIFASALSAAQVHRAASMPAPNESLVNLFAIKAAFLNEINGDLAAISTAK